MFCGGATIFSIIVLNNNMLFTKTILSKLKIKINYYFLNLVLVKLIFFISFLKTNLPSEIQYSTIQDAKMLSFKLLDVTLVCIQIII